MIFIFKSDINLFHIKFGFLAPLPPLNRNPNFLYQATLAACVELKTNIDSKINIIHFDKCATFPLFDVVNKSMIFKPHLCSGNHKETINLVQRGKRGVGEFKKLSTKSKYD